MTQFVVRVDGVEALNARYKKITKEMEDGARRVLAETATDIVAEMKRGIRVDTGAARNATGYTISDNGLKITIDVKKHYALYIEFGTRPHMPPPAALAAYVRRHRRPGSEWAMAKAIAKNGTRAYPFFYPAVRKYRADLIRRMREELEKAGEQ